ncbi:helix-turn-helix domain-containing protein [Bacillus licheniformis]|uniref:helix-turn-helix transcriptional regulator n=1 Tax=Bacillus licheniformis TaxID=1402 RepID=UPI00227E41E4|nr:helix-turn-helix domain-containing protein [Bacillus licheniformis]MCY9350693.1 helix-turn-helix domain-containing protein [Bacillus licheniformis]
MKRTILFSLRGDTPRSTIAKKLKITPQMLGAIERGDRTPSLLLAKKIADYYGKSVDEIFFSQNRHKTFLDKPKHRIGG